MAIERVVDPTVIDRARRVVPMAIGRARLVVRRGSAPLAIVRVLWVVRAMIVDRPAMGAVVRRVRANVLVVTRASRRVELRSR